MGFWDDGLFDFDGNGKTTEDEEFAAIATLAFLKAQDEQKKKDTSRNTQRYAPARSSPKPAAPPQTTSATSTEEQDEAVKPVQRRGRTGWIVIGVVAAIIASLIINSFVKSARVEAAYHKAETLIEQEDYSGALQLFGKMDPSYQDVKPLSTLCQAHLMYDRGRVADAYFSMKAVRFSHQTSEQKKRFDAFRPQHGKEIPPQRSNRAIGQLKFNILLARCKQTRIIKKGIFLRSDRNDGKRPFQRDAKLEKSGNQGKKPLNFPCAFLLFVI